MQLLRFKYTQNNQTFNYMADFGYIPRNLFIPASAKKKVAKVVEKGVSKIAQSGKLVDENSTVRHATSDKLNALKQTATQTKTITRPDKKMW